MHARRRRPTGGVLILTTSTGGGHDSVAVALREALHALAPEVGVRILDPFAGAVRWAAVAGALV